MNRRISGQPRNALLLLGMVLSFLIASCNLATSDTRQLELQVTHLVATLSVLQTGVAGQATLAAGPTLVPSPTNTPTVTLTPTPHNPVVIAEALCWVGPGTRYEVVSSIESGTVVQLLGQGDIAGWWVIENPRYHDPCWIEKDKVQIDPTTNLSILVVYSAPVLPKRAQRWPEWQPHPPNPPNPPTPPPPPPHPPTFQPPPPDPPAPPPPPPPSPTPSP